MSKQSFTLLKVVLHPTFCVQAIRLLLNDEQVMHPQFYAEKGKKEFDLLPSLGQF
jgi:hypothetical protein